MPIYFSRSAQGFFNTALAQYALPADAVEITVDEHAQLIKGNARGQNIVGDRLGRPVLSGTVANKDANRAAHGVELLGSGFPNGRYACDADAVDEVIANLAYIGCTNAFLTGRTLQVVLYDGTKVVYTDPDIYVRVMRQLLIYVNACKAYNKGTIKDLPGDTLTIT